MYSYLRQVSAPLTEDVTGRYANTIAANPADGFDYPAPQATTATAERLDG
jgi:hypothetical protein